MSDDVNFSALISARMCHDLISPIGAISNGLELLDLAGEPVGPEIDLIRQSAENASARLRFFLIAFSKPSDQLVGPEDALEVLRDGSKNSRSEFHWGPSEAVRQAEVQLIFLAILCLETATPYGAQIRVDQTDGRWQVMAEASRFKFDPDLWAHLENPETIPDILPSQVQFVLLTARVALAGRRLQLSQAEGTMSLSF